MKLSDFGFTKKVLTDRTYTRCGTPDYTAPEMLLNQGVNQACDWWALGILVFEMIVGMPPFTDPDGDDMKTYQNITVGDLFKCYPDDSKATDEARALIQGLCTVKVAYRLGYLKGGANDVMTHAWCATQRRRRRPRPPPLHALTPAPLLPPPPTPPSHPRAFTFTGTRASTGTASSTSRSTRRGGPASRRPTTRRASTRPRAATHSTAPPAGRRLMSSRPSGTPCAPSMPPTRAVPTTAPISADGPAARRGWEMRPGARHGRPSSRRRTRIGAGRERECKAEAGAATPLYKTR